MVPLLREAQGTHTAIQFLRSGTKGACNAMGVLDVEKSGINQFLNPTD